jgi:hypothetical protein
MDSPARRNANRRNAQLSTGPRTDAGKAASARNATKHGLLSREVVLSDESASEFDGLRDRLLTDLSPRGELQTVLAERITLAAWRLRRVVRLEAAVIRSQQKKLASLAEVATSPHSEPSPEETVHTAMVRDANETGQLERLRRYEVTFERSLFSSIHELERLQRRRHGEHTPAPAVIDVNVNKAEE